MILPLFTPSLLKPIAFEIISVPLNNSFAAMITFPTSTHNFFYIEQWRNIVKFIGRKNSRFLHINIYLQVISHTVALFKFPGVD